MAQNKDDDVQHPDSSGLATPTLNNDHVTDHQEHLIMSNGQTGETDRSNSSRKAIELTSSTLVSAISSTSTDSKKNKTVTNCASPSRQTETSNPRVQCLIQSAHLFKNADKLQPHVRVLDFGTPVKTNHSEGSKCNTSNVKKRHRGCEKEKKSRNKKQSVYHTKPVAHRKSVSLLNKPPTSTINKCATHENAHQSGIQQEYSNKNDHSVDQCNSRIQSGTNKLDIIAKDVSQKCARNCKFRM